MFILRLFFILLFPYLIFLQDRNFEISGHFLNSFGFLYFEDVEISSNNFYLGRSAFRVNFIKKKEFLKIDGSIDFNFLYGFYKNFFQHLNNTLKITEDSILAIDIRKLYIVLKYRFLDLYIGRQLLKFGEGYILNPLNLFSGIDFSEKTFTRVGVDAFRSKLQISNMGYLEGIFVSKVNVKKSGYVLKFISSIFGWDISFIGCYREELDWLSFGFSYKGDIVGGLYGEMLYNYAVEPTKRFYNFLVGFDYSFYQKILLRLEYAYNSFDINNFSRNEISFLPNFPFLSKHYFISQVTIFSNLIDNITFLILHEITSKKNFIIFSYKKSIFSNVELSSTLRYSNRDFFGFEFDTVCFLIDIILKF
ncbi:MAG: hypothetical protein ABDH23_03340 [Endomicrobiia bacterium]